MASTDYVTSHIMARAPHLLQAEVAVRAVAGASPEDLGQEAGRLRVRAADVRELGGATRTP